MTAVYVLFCETNTGRGQDSDGYVAAVYSSQQAAEDARDAAIQQAIADRSRVYWNPKTEQECADWEIDFRVEAHEVRDA